MRFATWVIFALLACAVVFTAQALVTGLYGADLPLNAKTLLLASGLSLLWALLIHKSEGLQRSVLLIAGIALFLSYVGRLLAITLDDRRFQYPFVVSFADSSVQHALRYLLAGTFMFWLGTKLTYALMKPRLQESRNPAERASIQIFEYRAVLLAVGLVAALFLFVLWVGFGQALTGTRAALLGHLILSTVGMCSLVLMYLAVKWWKDLGVPERFAIVAFFVLQTLAHFSVGGRSALYIPLGVWLTAVALVNPNQHIPVRSALLLVMVGALVLPLYLYTVTVFRELVRNTGATPLSLVSQGVPLFGTSQFSPAFSLVSNSFSGLDAFIATISYSAPGVEALFSPINIIVSTITVFVPDSLVPLNSIPLGKAFGYLYQGLPTWAAHSGAWSGFGFLYMTSGVFLPLAAFLLGAAVMGLMLRFARGSLWFAGLQLLVLSFVTQFFISGNVDIIIGELVINAVVLAGLAIICESRKARREQVTPLALHKSLQA